LDQQEAHLIFAKEYDMRINVAKAGKYSVIAWNGMANIGALYQARHRRGYGIK